MSKPFAVFDIDGTLIRWQLYHAIADELAKQGQLSTTSYAQIKLARMEWKKRTNSEAFRKYERKLVTFYDLALRDLMPEQFDKAVGVVVEEYKEQTYTYTRNLIRSLKAKDYLLFAISGSQAEPVAKLAEYYGFDDYLGTDYIRDAGSFTGEIIFHAQDKKKALQKLVDKYSLNYEGSLAIGDSMSDVPMLEMVERAIAFNPDKHLFAAAKAKGWGIVVERKNVTYELENQNGTYILV